MTPATSRAGDAIRGLVAVLAVAVLVAGIPAALWTVVGWPLPNTVPTWSDISRALADTYVPDVFLVNALAVVCWLAWAQLVASLAVETAAAIRRRPAPNVPLAGPLQTAAAHLVAAILLLGTLTGPRHVPAGPPPPTAAQVAAVPADGLLAAAPPPPSPAQVPADEPDRPRHAVEQPAPQPTYTVQRFDDLWSIAERHLADPYRWTDIWDLNRGRTFDGTTFCDPDLIHPGWTLQLPRDATGLTVPPRPAPHADTPPTPQSPPSDEPAEQEPSDDAPTEEADPTSGGSDDERPDPTAPRDSADPTPAGSQSEQLAPTAPSTTADSAPPLDRTSPPETSDQPAPTTPASDADADDPSDPLVDLPSGAAVGLALAAAASAALAAARLQRRRRHLPGDPQPGIAHRDPLAPAVVRRLRRAHLAHQAATITAPNGDADLRDHPSTPPPVDRGDTPGRSLKPDLARLGTLCLTGSGATDTARAVLTTFLLADTPTASGRVLIASPEVAELLLPSVARPPGLDIADSLDAALTDLEVELISRSRLLDSFDVADFTTLARRHPEQPVPAILLITPPPDSATQPRLDAVLGLGGRLGVNAILLGPIDSWPTVTVASGGTVTDVHPADERAGLVGTRLDTLTAADAADLLAAAAAAHDVPAQPEPPEAAAEDFTAPAPLAAAPPVTVRMLGPLAVAAAGEEIRTGLRHKARELFAYFLLHPQGATLEAAVDALWPDADPTRGVERFRTVLGNLRSTLRDATGIEPAAIIDRVGERYQADATLIDCDLWRFEHALTDAAAATEDVTLTEALERAAAAYCGDLCHGAYYEWAEAPREDLRRRAVDATARLAELRQAADDPDGALDALEQAVRHDPYTEELYRRIMRLQAALGRPDAVRRTYRLLETRLTDLDVEPDDATEQLLADLLAQQGVGATHQTGHVTSAS